MTGSDYRICVRNFCFVLVTNRQGLVSRICITLCPLIIPQRLSPFRP